MTFNFVIPVVRVVGNVATIIIGGVPGKGTITSFSGPTGPTPDAAHTGPSTILAYGGTLTNGNHFGTCDVLIRGQYAEPGAGAGGAPSSSGGGPGGAAGGFLALAKFFTGLFKKAKKQPQAGTFDAKSVMSIQPPDKPTYTPDPVVVPRGQPGQPRQVTVTVTPAGSYLIVCRPKDEDAGLFVQNLVQTDSGGVGQCQVQDLVDVERGPLIVLGTISPQAPCTGSPVESQFSVNVK